MDQIQNSLHDETSNLRLRNQQSVQAIDGESISFIKFQRLFQAHYE